MSALERLKGAANSANVYGSCGVSAADLIELIATVEKRDAEVESLVESSAAALHAEVERGNALAVRVAELESALASGGVEVRGGMFCVVGARRCSVCGDDDTKRLDCRVCGQTGLADLEDVRPDYRELSVELVSLGEAFETLRKERDTLRAELAGAQAQAAAAARERDGFRVDLKEAQQSFVRATRECDRLRAQLAARDAEVPGLSTTPGYTLEDVAKIEAARGRPYAKLRETVRELDEALVREDVLRKAIFGLMGSPGYVELSVIDRDRARAALSFAATSNETKEVES